MFTCFIFQLKLFFHLSVGIAVMELYDIGR